MDNTGSDKLALGAFYMAFSIQRILQSRLIPPEAKERLVQDYKKLTEQVSTLTKIREERETTQKMSDRKQPKEGGLTHDDIRH
jgi:hypothetical protein